MHRMIFGDPKAPDAKQAATAPARIPQPGCLLAEMIPIDVPKEINIREKFIITDDYFVSCEECYVVLYRRKGHQVGQQIKLNHVGRNLKFTHGIKIQDGKDQIDCIVTASKKSVRLWKCDDLRPDVAEKPVPFNEWYFDQEEIRGINLCPDQKTLVVTLREGDDFFDTYFRILNLESGKCSSLSDMNSRNRDLLLFQNDMNVVRLISYTYDAVSVMSIDTAQHTGKEIDLKCVDAAEKSGHQLACSLDTNYVFIRHFRWCRMLSRYQPDQKQEPFILTSGRFYHEAIANRLFYTGLGAEETGRCIFDPDNYGFYFYPGVNFRHNIIKTSNATKSQLYIEENGLLYAVEFHAVTSYSSATKLEPCVLKQSLPEIPLPVCGIVSQYVGSFWYCQPKWTHPGIFSTALLATIMKTLQELDRHAYLYAEPGHRERLKEPTPLHVDSLKILKNALKHITKLKTANRLTEAAIFDILPLDPNGDHAGEVLPEVEALIDKIRTETLEYVKAQKTSCCPIFPK